MHHADTCNAFIRTFPFSSICVGVAVGLRVFIETCYESPEKGYCAIVKTDPNYSLFFVVVSVFVFIVPGANDICDIPSEVDNNS